MIEKLASYLELGMWGFVALLVLIGLIKGLTNGFFRETIRSATYALSFFLSFKIVEKGYSKFSSFLANRTTAGLVARLEKLGISSLDKYSDTIVESDTTALNHVLALPMSVILLPIAFVSVFLMLNVVLKIVYKIICAIFRFTTWRNNMFTRVLGMFLGMTQGFVIAIICLSPVIGILTTTATAVKEFEESPTYADAAESVKTRTDKYLKPFTNNSCVEKLAPLGASKIYNKLSTVKINGKSHNLPKEVAGPSLELVSTVLTIKDLDLTDISPKNRKALENIIDVVDRTPYFQIITADAISAIASTYNPDMQSDSRALAESLQHVIEVFVDIEPENVAPTMELVLDTIFLIGVNYNDLSDEDRADFDRLVSLVEEDEYDATILATILDAIATAYDSQTIMYGDDISGNLVRNVFYVFKDIEPNEVAPTLAVVRDVLFMLDDEGALYALNEDASLLSDIMSKKDENGDTLITKITVKLNSCDNTRPLVSSMTKISILVMAESMPKVEGAEITEETYDNVKNSLNTNIVDINQKYKDVELVEGTPEYEEYITEVSDTLSESLVENGINVDKPVADEMAKYVAENHKDKVEELSEEEMNDIILSYYNAYLETGKLPTVPETPETPENSETPEVSVTP